MLLSLALLYRRLKWLVRHVFEVIEKMQTENIRAVKPKEEAVRDFYLHTHEMMKRLVFI